MDEADDGSSDGLLRADLRPLCSPVTPSELTFGGVSSKNKNDGALRLRIVRPPNPIFGLKVVFIGTSVHLAIRPLDRLTSEFAVDRSSNKEYLDPSLSESEKYIGSR